MPNMPAKWLADDKAICQPNLKNSKVSKCFCTFFGAHMKKYYWQEQSMLPSHNMKLHYGLAVVSLAKLREGDSRWRWKGKLSARAQKELELGFHLSCMCLHISADATYIYSVSRRSGFRSFFTSVTITSFRRKRFSLLLL